MSPLRRPPLWLLTASFLVAPLESSASVPASHPDLRYDGRFDNRDPESVGVIWQASRIALAFEGDWIELRFSDPKGQSFLDVTLDGNTSVVEFRDNQPPQNVRFENLGPGPHQLTVFKRSEADAGHIRFNGVRLPSGGKILPLAPRPAGLRFQFFGDSITVGACNEDGAADQWDDRRTHNAAKSYAAFTAAEFDADYRNIAVSGMGISIGWVEKTAGEIWDRVYPDPASARADLNTWVPHVVFVNLGENDDSYSNAKDLPFPETYTDRYVSLVHGIRRAWPSAQIVILRGGMHGGARSERLRQPWERAVAQLEAGDRRISHFVFKHWSELHPRVADHRAMADELIAWLRSQEFMRR